MIAGTLTEVLNGKSYDATAAYVGDEAIEGAFVRLPHMFLSDLILSSTNRVALATTMAGIDPG
jgi:hypothetical protein